MRLSYRLVFFSLGLIAAFVLVTGIIIERGFQRRVMDERVGEMAREARLITSGAFGNAPQDLARAASIAVGGRVTLVDSAGIIKGDADQGVPTRRVGTRAKLPEVSQALATGVGVSSRSGAAGEARELYVAVPARGGGVARVATSIASIEQIFGQTRRDLLAAGLVALAFATFFSVIVARYVSKPIVQLRDFAQGLSRREFPNTQPINAPGEVGDLAEALQQLAVRLETLEMVRTDFIANISHELCSPLTIASGFAATLAKEDLPAAMRREFATAILSNTARMQGIIDELLDLSRIETGGWIPRAQATRVIDIADEVINSLNPAAASKGVSIVIDIQPDAQVIHADPAAVRQIIANLSENAVRHTAHGAVTIFTDRQRDSTWIGVRDTGEGISAEHLSRVFERFYRVDRGRRRHSGGSGLGLAIVKHMTEAHGGRVRAESTVGSGTTISAFFPSTTTKRRTPTPIRPMRAIE